MATPRKVATDLRRTAQRLAKIPDQAVAEAATFAVEEGTAAGGRFGGARGRSQLSVVVRSQSSRRGAVSATVAGKTAAAWSIKSYGRRGGYTVRPNTRRRRRALDMRRAGLPMSAVASARPGGTRGDDRWSRWIVEPVTDRFTDLFDDLVDDAVEG